MNHAQTTALIFPQVGFSRLERAFWWATAVVTAFGIVASVHPELRAGLRAMALSDGRTVLSTASGRLGSGQELFTVAKIQTRDFILLEIYENAAEGTRRLVDKIELTDKRDGFFDFKGRALNLAIEDIDGDGTLEIVAPTFDVDLVGRLNVFRYDADARGFQRRAI